MHPINVLIFPCGSEVGLELNRSLKDISFITLYGGSSVPDHGRWEYERYIGDIPYITDKDLIPKLNEIINTYHIDFIFPTIDSVVLKLAEIQQFLNAKVLTSCLETVKICSSKKRTYDFLAGEPFMPRVYSDVKAIREWPVLLKPAVGCGGQGVKIIYSRNELLEELNHRDAEQVICEYLPGMEYTVDCFTDHRGKLKYCAHRSRRKVKNGMSVNSVLEPESKEIWEIGKRINEKLKFRGVWFFQVKLSKNNEFKLMEIATRMAGTMCVSRARGVNLPLITIFDAAGCEVSPLPQFDYVETDRDISNCYKVDLDFDELYIDYDDTIIVHDKVNLMAISLIYKCLNKGIPVYLVTKHAKNIHKSLKERKICEDIFTEIIAVKMQEKKIDYMHPGARALYVDDSFAERKMVWEKFGIKVMGVDSLEVLLNGVMMG